MFLCNVLSIVMLFRELINGYSANVDSCYFSSWCQVIHPVNLEVFALLIGLLGYGGPDNQSAWD
jgi:hypothetical protein